MTHDPLAARSSSFVPGELVSQGSPWTSLASTTTAIMTTVRRGLGKAIHTSGKQPPQNARAAQRSKVSWTTHQRVVPTYCPEDRVGAARFRCQLRSRLACSLISCERADNGRRSAIPVATLVSRSVAKTFGSPMGYWLGCLASLGRTGIRHRPRPRAHPN